MTVSEALALIKPGIVPSASKSTWADLGCGSGLFTTALSQLLLPGSTVFAVDKSRQVLEKIQETEEINLNRIAGDFTDSRILIPASLDGILMANAFHFVEDKTAFIQKAAGWLKENGSFLFVEYDTDSSNRWVPYPISFQTAQTLFKQLGYTLQKKGTHPSLYHFYGMYSACAAKN